MVEDGQQNCHAPQCMALGDFPKHLPLVALTSAAAGLRMQEVTGLLDWFVHTTTTFLGEELEEARSLLSGEASERGVDRCERTCGALVCTAVCQLVYPLNALVHYTQAICHHAASGLCTNSGQHFPLPGCACVFLFFRGPQGCLLVLQEGWEVLGRAAATAAPPAGT